MTDAARLLSRYLRQRTELGETELLLPPGLVDELGRKSPESDSPPVPTGPRGAAPGAPPIERTGPSRPRATPRSAPPEPLPEIGELRVLQAADGSRSFLVRAGGQPGSRVVMLADAVTAGDWPFNGAAGSLLDRLLLAVGVPGDDVLRCMVVPEPETGDQHGATSDATPLTPDVIVACGAAALHALLEREEPLTRLRGRDLDFGGTPVVATHGLGALVRHPAWLRPAWNDFQRLRTMLDG